MSAKTQEEINQMVYELHTALIGNGVEGAVPRILKCIEKNDEKIGELEDKVDEHLTRHDERGKLFKMLAAIGTGTGATGLATAIAAFFK